MDLHKISVKIFAERDMFEPAEFLPIFHQWIQTHRLADHLLVDVADYAHVPNGPGTVLVTSQANLSTDRGGGRFGLLYFRKLAIESANSFRSQLQGTMKWALQSAALLEADPALRGRLKFKTDELQIRLHDRLLAPNTAETFAAHRADFQAVADLLYGPQAATLSHQPSDLTLLEVDVKASRSPALEELIKQV